MRLSTTQQSIALSCLIHGLNAVTIAAGLDIDRGRLKRYARIHELKSQLGPHGGLTEESRTRAQDLLGTITGMNPLSYTDTAGRLTAAARCTIYAMLKYDESHATIAETLGVHRTTVWREITRNTTDGKYCPVRAHLDTTDRAKRPKSTKFEKYPRLRHAVITGLNKRWSPRQISKRLARVHPGDQAMSISHETVYQALYVQGRGALRHELTCEKALRSGRIGRKPRSKLPRASNRSWIGEGSLIADRPDEVDDRRVPGHWEGDLMIGANGSSAMVTLVERSTQSTMLRVLGVDS